MTYIRRALCGAAGSLKSIAQSFCSSFCEKCWCNKHVASNKTGSKQSQFSWAEAREALTDIKVLLLVLYQLVNSIPNGAITSVCPTPLYTG